MPRMFLDRRGMDNFVFKKLVEAGYAADVDEVQDITDIMIELLIHLRVLHEEELEDDIEILEEIEDEDED
jgi:hypothetical protein